MESGERLAHPSSTSPSVRTAAPSATPSPTSSSPALTSPLSTCGHLFRAGREQPFSTAKGSSAFPMVQHPAFGVFTASSGHSDFGGLGTLGVPAALAAHPPIGAFADWWRASEAHGRSAAAFFPPLLGLPPLFRSPIQTRDSSPPKPRTPSKNGRGTLKGVNGAVNGSPVSTSVKVHPSTIVPPMPGILKQKKPANSTESPKGGQIQEKTPKKPKEKKQPKKTLEGTSISISDSESGSSLDTSSEAMSSSDSEDLEDDDDDEEPSHASEDSDSEKESGMLKKAKVTPQDLCNTQTTGAVKREAYAAPLAMETQIRKRKLPHKVSPTLLSLSAVPTHTPSELRCIPLLIKSPKSSAEMVKPYLSVIQATGSAVSCKPLALVTQPRREALPKPLSLCPSPKSFSLSLSPKVKSLAPTPSPPALSPNSVKASSQSWTDKSPSPLSDFRLKQEHFKQAFPTQLKKQREEYRSRRKLLSSLPPPLLSPETPISHQLSPPYDNPPSLFLSGSLLGQHRANGVIQSAVQEAPLALVSKPRAQSTPQDKLCSEALPVNLSTTNRKPLPLPKAPALVPLPPPSSTSPSLASLTQTKCGTSQGLAAEKKPLLHSTADILQSSKPEGRSSKGSDDSAEEEEEEEEDEDDDDDDDDEDDEDTDDSLSDSGSDSGSEDDLKQLNGTANDTEAEKLSLGLSKSTGSLSTTADFLADCSPLNLQVIKLPVPAGPSCGTSSSPASKQPGAGKKKATDDQELRMPLEFGWQRETKIKNPNGRMQSDVAYYTPCGKKIRQYPDIVKYLSSNGISDLTCSNFSFSAKVRVGDFYEARDGPQGMQWRLLEEQEVIPRILAMGGRRGQRSAEEPRSRRKKAKPSSEVGGEFSSAADAKLLRKLEAQEIARQAAQLKLIRKLERQALAQAAKEAKKQQAIMAAEEKRKRKEEIKIQKQQEKIKRIQQIRIEKELRAQQILEAKRKKKEEAANAKILEAEKRIKEKELRRQQAIILKHQELERHRLDMERERRRQHMMLLKAVEARKKAEERERLRQEKRDEKRLNKERKLELRRLELELAQELKKTTEDMCLADHKPFPALSRVPGLVLTSSPFIDCLMVLQFLRTFGKVLGLDVSMDVPGLGVLQEGLLNLGNSMGRVQDLLVRMLSLVVCDPGLPPGHKAKTALGEHLTNVGINRDNVSEILQMYMEAHCGQTELAPLADSLKTKAFQAHTPPQKASVLAFLVNELACSKSVVSEIDKNIDQLANLKRDKTVIEGKLRKLKNIHAKKTGKREAGLVGEEAQALGTPSSARKRKRKGGDSDDDEDDDEDSDEQGEEEDEDEEDGKKGKKAETCDDEDDGDQTASVEELEKQIDKLTKQQNQNRRKVFEASQFLRCMTFGQDRYRRRYWVLPQCGGVFVEGAGMWEGPEDTESECEVILNAGTIQVKEEPVELLEEKPLIASQKHGGKNTLNHFLQNSNSNLGKLLEVAKVSSNLQHPQRNNSPMIVAKTEPIIPASIANIVQSSSLPHSLMSSTTGRVCDPLSLLPSDQLLRVLTERSAHWFSLLPRSPCDESSLTSPLKPSAASPQPSSSSSPASAPTFAAHSPQNPSISTMVLLALQAKPDLHLLSPTLCGWSTGMLGPTRPLSNSPMPPVLDAAYPAAESNSTPVFTPSLTPTTKSESPDPPSEKPPSAPSPAVEVAKPQDYSSPQPIPEEMRNGWWKVADMEELRRLVSALHSRGIREKALQKQIQKHMEFIAHACTRNRDVTIIDVTELKENQVTEETLESWCVEEQAMEVDIAMLQQVEELERKVTAASLQLKGWIYPEAQSEREDLVYHEHKICSQPQSEGETGASEAREASREGGIARRVNNPLDIAVSRLAELEKNIERRYLKSPLSTTIQIKLDNVGTVTVPAPAPSSSADGEGEQEEVAPGMKVWRKALSEVRNSAQLALCIQHLQRSIAWERSIMKVYCQVCRRGDNEELLLLCDGCDKGCHTYCHRPKITTIPEGDWFCPTCISKASGQSPKSKKLQNRGSGGGGAAAGKKTPEVKRSKKPCVAAEVVEDESVSCGSTNTTPKKGTKETRKKKAEESPSVCQPKSENNTPTKRAKPSKDNDNNNDRDLALCSILLAELEEHQDAWPFLRPVDPKSVPGYRKVIKKPMDFSTIREKLSNLLYQNLETFIIDVNLVFDNCEKFNEDNSEIGRAGHNMRKFFERRWPELLKTT